MFSPDFTLNGQICFFFFFFFAEKWIFLKKLGTLLNHGQYRPIAALDPRAERDPLQPGLE